MSATAKVSRAAFFIFNPSLVPETPKPSEEELQDAKIIYYSPSCAPIEEKRSQVGMIEGLISFTAMFSGEEGGPLRHIRTKQLAFSVMEVEPRIWMVLVMRHAMAADGQSDEDSLYEKTLQAVLRNCYNVFRLLHGEIEAFIKAQSMHKLFDLLEDFVPAFLETVVASDLGIFQELEGFHYSPVERNTCVSIHCFLDKLQEQFACVRHATLLYNAHLVYTNLPLDDMRVLYSYLVAFNGAVSSQKLNKPPFGRIPTAASQPGGGSSSFGRAFLLTEEEDFLMGMSRRAPNGPPSIFVPAVHLNAGVGQLVALTYKSIMLVLILDEDVQVDARLLESLRDSCNAASGDGLSLAELQPLIAPQYKEIMEQEDEYRFVYYNHTNHALRLSNQASMSRSLLRTTGVTSLGPKAAEKPLLTPLHATLADPKLKCREVSCKSADRGWICAKRWCDREFYLLLDGTSTSLSRCQEECARFASIHFSNIVMM